MYDIASLYCFVLRLKFVTGSPDVLSLAFALPRPWGYFRFSAAQFLWRDGMPLLSVRVLGASLFACAGTERRTAAHAASTAADRFMSRRLRLMSSAYHLGALLLSLVVAASASGGAQTTYRIDHVTDGDTVVLRNGQKVRLVQIDTPEVYFGTECYGPQASATTKRLLPVGTPVRLTVEPATDRADDYGRGSFATSSAPATA